MKTPQHIKPYGDTLNDGFVQLSFSLPIPYEPKSDETAKQLIEKMGFFDVSIVHSEALSATFSHYIAYAKTQHSIDPSTVEIESHGTESMDKETIEKHIAENFTRPLVFIGASTGSDAHTVGIDAIMNMKGFGGHYGLERYQGIEAINLGSQVDNETLLQEALKHKADVILISQTVTQKNIHIQNLTAFIELLEAENLRDQFIVIIGGARINHTLAKELGYDAGFGPKSYAFDVASFALTQLLHKKQKR